MSVINVGDRVETLFSYPGKMITGTVKEVYEIEDQTLVIVKTDDDRTLKFTEEQLAVLKINNKDEITITRDVFEEAVSKVTKPYYYRDNFSEEQTELLSVSAVLICNRLRKEFFGAKADND